MFRFGSGRWIGKDRRCAPVGVRTSHSRLWEQILYFRTVPELVSMATGRVDTGVVAMRAFNRRALLDGQNWWASMLHRLVPT